jgi:pimeloyl-CoA synthetase
MNITERDELCLEIRDSSFDFSSSSRFLNREFEGESRVIEKALTAFLSVSQFRGAIALSSSYARFEYARVRGVQASWTYFRMRALR